MQKARIKGALERVKCQYTDLLYNENELPVSYLFDTIVIK